MVPSGDRMDVFLEKAELVREAGSRVEGETREYRRKEKGKTGAKESIDCPPKRLIVASGATGHGAKFAEHCNGQRRTWGLKKKEKTP